MRIDMSRSLLTIDKAAFIQKLSSLLGNHPIFDLLVSFLKIDYIYDIYIEKSILDSILPRIQFSIPPAGFLTSSIPSI